VLRASFGSTLGNTSTSDFAGHSWVFTMGALSTGCPSTSQP
jgi:hypothetical protein